MQKNATTYAQQPATELPIFIESGLTFLLFLLLLAVL